MEREESILARTARGAGWVMAWRMATRLLGLFSTLVLVRLLVPEDFGLVALATSFAFALDACLLIGVEDQIVRAKKPDRALYDTAFTITLLRAVVVGAILAALAPAAAVFFAEPRLIPILYALALATAASGLANIGVVDFRRQLEFHREFKLMIAPRIASILLMLAVAMVTHSYWALVVGILSHRAGMIVLGYTMHPYRPRLSLAEWRYFLTVTGWSWAIGLADMLRSRMDSIVIGRSLGSTDVGVFAAGFEIATLPTAEFSVAAGRALMPGFADARRGENKTLEQETFLRIAGVGLLCTLPAGLGISAVAEPLIRLALGPVWSGAVPVVAVVGPACALATLDAVGTGWLRAHAVLGRLFAIIMGAALLRLLLLLILVATLGVPGAAWAAAIGMASQSLIAFAFAAHGAGIAVPRLVAVSWRAVVATAAMSLVLLALDLGWSGPSRDAAAATAVLAGAVGVGLVTYATTVVVLWLASGRPPHGPEADALRALKGAAGRLQMRRLVAGRVKGASHHGSA